MQGTSRKSVSRTVEGGVTRAAVQCGVDMHSHFLLFAHHLGHRFSRPSGEDGLPGPLADRISLEYALAGGVRCITFAVYVPVGRWGGIPAVMDQIDTFERVVAESGGRLVRARTGTEARQIAAAGGVAGVLAVEGGHGLDVDPGALQRLADRGVRMITLTHLVSSALADTAESPWRPHGGLAPAGRDVVRRMGRLGMFPDLAHMSVDAMDQALAESEGPVVCSHTGMRACCDRPRNLADAQARRIAATGGMIGIFWFAPYLSRDVLRAGVSLETFLDHCCHAASVAGAGHVGIGTDLDAAFWLPTGLRDHRDFPSVADGLRRRGLSPAEVDGIMGDNYLRLLGDTPVLIGECEATPDSGSGRRISAKAGGRGEVAAGSLAGRTTQG